MVTHPHVAEGLAAALCADSLNALIHENGWLAMQLVDRLREWLQWPPTLRRLHHVLESISDNPWFPLGHRIWAEALRSQANWEPQDRIFLWQRDQEQQELAKFQIRMLRKLPMPVVRAMSVQVFLEVDDQRRGAPRAVFREEARLFIQQSLEGTQPESGRFPISNALLWLETERKIKPISPARR